MPNGVPNLSQSALQFPRSWIPKVNHVIALTIPPSRIVFHSTANFHQNASTWRDKTFSFSTIQRKMIIKVFSLISLTMLLFIFHSFNIFALRTTLLILRSTKSFQLDYIVHERLVLHAKRHWPQSPLILLLRVLNSPNWHVTLPSKSPRTLLKREKTYTLPKSRRWLSLRLSRLERRLWS